MKSATPTWTAFVVGLAACAWVCPSTFAQAIAPRGEVLVVKRLAAGKQLFAWQHDCTTAPIFLNKTGSAIGGLWVAIDCDNLNNPPEIAEIRVRTTSGVAWDVDDNENGNNDDAGENDATDATPLSEPTGWHRVQARSNSDLILADQEFTLRLCDSSGLPLSGRTIALFAMEPGTNGGDGSAAVVFQGSFGFDTTNPQRVVTIDVSDSPPTLTFRVDIDNTGSFPFSQINLQPGQTDFGIISASSSAGGDFNPMTGDYVWTSPRLPGSRTDLIFTLDSLSGLVSPLIGTTTTVILTVSFPPSPALPAISPIGLVALCLSIAAAAVLILRSRLS